MAIETDARARRTALRIVGILGILVLLCCTGGAWFTYRISEGLSARMKALDSRIGEAYPEGTVWRLEQFVTPAPDHEMKRVLVVGFPEPTPEDRHEETVDGLWTVYCEAFADGGIALDEIALGTAGDETPFATQDDEIRHAGYVKDWSGHRYDVHQAAARTGKLPPPDVSLIEWFGDSATVTAGEDDRE